LKVLELRHAVGQTRSTSGGGTGAGLTGLSKNIYAEVMIWKI